MTKMLATAALALAFIAPAYAQEPPPMVAQITDIDGRVLVNQGDEFKPAVKGLRLKPGDRVMVQDDSNVVITYDDECKMDVDENKIVTISDRSTCAGGTPLVQQLNPTGGAAIGASGGGPLEWAFTALVVGTEIAWLLDIDHNDDDEDDDDVVSP